MPDFTKKLTCLFLVCEVWTGCPPAQGMDQIREGDQKLDYFCPSYRSLLWGIRGERQIWWQQGHH